MLTGTKIEILKDIGDRIRQRRLMCGLSQKTAAERSGISVMTLQALEKGKGSSLWTLVSLCRTYDHTQWIHELAPDEEIRHIIAVNSGKVRQRASKRKEVRHV